MPSLLLTINFDLGTKKKEILKACSKLVSEHTGKPEQWISTCLENPWRFDFLLLILMNCVAVFALALLPHPPQ
jgi:hypothetical protein